VISVFFPFSLVDVIIISYAMLVRRWGWVRQGVIAIETAGGVSEARLLLSTSSSLLLLVKLCYCDEMYQDNRFQSIHQKNSIQKTAAG